MLLKLPGLDKANTRIRKGFFCFHLNFDHNIDILLLSIQVIWIITLPNHRLHSDLCFSFFQLRKEKTWISARYLKTYCYSGHYMFSLLADGYKFDKDTFKNINFAKQVGWTKKLLAPTTVFCYSTQSYDANKYPPYSFCIHENSQKIIYALYI